ncbi:2-C-methyl-D-erythritol 4-phosphate cytidylyltransferase [Georgenia sp. 10Sc9-8]|uniref:2-C-methyl-D-erythritol 4-phosphate cytidylyltransferase n=1 Tax=Georgenia halotolerans TaxID=3028317 RepID=A0ABT5TXV1_9MICO|nr:2-C-methyl-D-erythritol 4-phosphate cytidylyltransferase [Georgenia halotolerans]
MSTGAVLTAAGSGSRLGRPVPKALVELAGVPLVVRAAQNLAASGCVTVLVITVPGHVLDDFEVLFPGGRVPGHELPVRLVPGGATRQASVAAGLAALPAEVDVVLVHDAARCLAPPELAATVEAAVRGGRRAVVPALPVTDTIKQVDPARARSGAEPVTATVDRTALRAVQTPQGFLRAALADAHARGVDRGAAESTAASDDAGLAEAAGEQVWVVPGDLRALKVTTPTDLALAELLLS